MPDGLLMKYFVLKPRGSSVYSAASRAAIRRYADVIGETNPLLAQDLIDWADREFANMVDDDDLTVCAIQELRERESCSSAEMGFCS